VSLSVWQPPVENGRRLWLAIAVSVLAHGLLLLVHFTFPEASRAMREKALDIILVNARSASRPVDAQALAQSNLDGGGNTDDDRRAKTPLPPTPQQSVGEEVQQRQRRAQDLEAVQQKMLTQARSCAALPASRPPARPRRRCRWPAAPTCSSRRGRWPASRGKSAGRRRIQQAPRKKFVGARAEEYRLAAYLDAWKQKIERIGTLNYPRKRAVSCMDRSSSSSN
jgi:protein TonB